MPNRILRESICRSDSIDQLSWFEEAFFYRLIVNADDYGRFDGRPAIIRGSCFPLKDVRFSQIDSAIEKLASVNMIYTYEIDGRTYIQIVNWGEYQQVRSKKSKYPAPLNCENENLISNDIKCNQMISDVTVIQSNPNPNTNPNPNPNIYSATSLLDVKESDILSPLESWFITFWNAYPRKSDKKKAHDKFVKVCKSEELFNKIMNGVNNTVIPKATADGTTKYIPLATTWLNGERWEDEPYRQSNQQKGGNWF